LVFDTLYIAEQKTKEVIPMKKTLSILLAIILAVTLSVSVYALPTESAAENEESPPTRFSYINVTATVLTFSGGKAVCGGSISGYNGTTTKVEIELTLQRRTLLLFWSDEVTGRQTFNTWRGNYELAPRPSVSSGTTYRVKAVYTAWAGSNKETHTTYSGTAAAP